MKKLLVLLTAALLTTACSPSSFDVSGLADEDSGLETSVATDSAKRDTRVNDTFVEDDTFVEEDALVPDTFVPDDTTADSGPVTDSFVPDTFAEKDSFVPDSFVPKDSFVPDTFKPDTFVEDAVVSEVDTGPKGPCDDIEPTYNAVIFTLETAPSGYLGFAGVVGVGTWADPLYSNTETGVKTVVLNVGPRAAGTKIQFIVGRSSSSGTPLMSSTIYSSYNTTEGKFHSGGTYIACHGKMKVGSYVEPSFSGALKQSDSSPTTEKLMFIVPP